MSLLKDGRTFSSTKSSQDMNLKLPAWPVRDPNVAEVAPYKVLNPKSANFAT